MGEDGAIPVAVADDETAALSRASGGRPPTAPQRRATLKVLTGAEAGRLYIIDAEETVVGRGAQCDLQMEDTALSRRHFRLFRNGGDFAIEDLGSRNGTLLDGEPVTSARALREGALIQLRPGTVLKFSLQNQLEVEAEQRLYASAVQDPLTGLHNRRHLDERLRAELAFASRHAASLSVLIIDVDHFKAINDTRGHDAGDAALRALGERLLRSVRTEDIVARHGGEEFAVVARGIGAVGALQLAERIRDTVAKLRIAHGGGAPLAFTVSIGVATMDRDCPFDDAAALLKAADEMLYRAKQGGRNRCLHTPSQR